MDIVCKKLFYIYHPNGFFVDRHKHRSHELVYCLEGQGTVHINNQKSEFSTGDYYITRAGTIHTESDDCNTSIIYFYFDAPDELVCEGIHSDYDASILSMVKKLRQETEENELHKESMMQALLTRILIEALRSEKNNTGKQGIRAVLKYVNENIDREIDFKKLAKQQHYSFDRFRHIFKEYTGFSPHQYIINARVEKAKILLRLNPNASLTEISFNCGFSSSSHFSKAFRSKVGTTPSEYAASRGKY